MRLHRFYVKQPLGEELVVGSAIEDKELLHQWTSVFRYSRGNEVILFPKHDQYDYTYFIEDISKKEATFCFLSKTKNIQPHTNCTLYMALVKKDTFETIVRQATELGVSTIVPILADKSEKKNLNFERLQAIATEASEQSGRGTVPFIREIVTFKEAVTTVPKNLAVFGSLTGSSFETLKKKIRDESSTSVWIGPEGGWSQQEEELARSHSFFDVKLTETTLKADTAATSLLSLVLVP